MNIISFFNNTQTIRVYNGYFYNIGEAISIIILGLMCGLKNLNQIHIQANSEIILEFLKEELGIKKVPCYYWLTVLVKIIDIDSLNECFQDWIESLVCMKDTTISLDGKYICSITKKNPLNIISAQLADYGLTLAQSATSDKKNEIVVVQELLKKLKIKSCLITADALHCQEETTKIIVDKKADYLLKVKSNQKNLFNDIKSYFNENSSDKNIDTCEITEKNKNRIEKRTAFVSNNITTISNKEKWANLKTIGIIKTEVTYKNKVTNSCHFFISSRNLTAEQLLKNARKEWSVETMHWLLDVHFDEDKCRITDKNVQISLNIFRKVAINYIKLYKDRNNLKEPLTHIMLKALMKPSMLKQILFTKN